MSTSYEIRAEKFAHVLAHYFSYCVTLQDFEEAIEAYNATHSIPLRYAHGVSRIAIMRADYVIKFNYQPLEVWQNEFGNCRAGDNSTEAQVYARAVSQGYGYLLAKTTTIVIEGRTVSIMPLINDVGDEHKYWGDYVTDEEYDWLTDNIYDIHENNVGYKRGKPVVVDYGWDAYE